MDQNPSSNRPAAGEPTREPRIRSAMLVPAENARIDRLPLWGAYLLAVLLPVLVAVVLIPFRDSLGQSAALILIIPVIAVALLGGTAPAMVAAVSAGASFGVLLTQPYGQFAIHNSSDVVATVVLLVIGAAVGFTAVREHRFANRAELRLDELERILAFAELSAASQDRDQLLDSARAHLTALLQLERCTWTPGPHTSSLPLLLDDGQIMGYVRDLPPDRSQLPASGAELLAQTDTDELGHFVLIPVAGATSSVEQRRTAAGIANLLAVALARSNGSLRRTGSDRG